MILLVEVTPLPVKARTRLAASLTTTLRQIDEMENRIACGIKPGKRLDIYSPANLVRLEQASTKANAALSAAETFRPFCSYEPRIKGSLEGLALICSDVIFVLPWTGWTTCIKSAPPVGTPSNILCRISVSIDPPIKDRHPL